MQLILHIGSGKTGTSTLQAALHGHAKALRRSGVLYPKPKFGKANHNYLVTLFYGAADVPREFRPDRAHYDTIRAQGTEFWEDLTRQVRSSDAHTAILSGEYFFGLNPARVVELHRLLTDVFSDIRVVAYVRHPSTYYVSWMQQQVKASFEVRPPGSFRLRMKACLTRYLEQFDGQVSVRSAHRESLKGGSIVHDFMAAFVPKGDDLATRLRVTDLNESMSAEAMCIMQALRRHAWPDENDHFAPESNHVVDALNELRERSSQAPAALKPPLNAAMTRRHQEDIDWLRQTFGVVLPTLGVGAVHGLGDGEPDGWTSDDLTEILDVDRNSVDRTLFCLLRELATRDLRRKVKAT